MRGALGQGLSSQTNLVQRNRSRLGVVTLVMLRTKVTKVTKVLISPVAVDSSLVGGRLVLFQPFWFQKVRDRWATQIPSDGY